MLYIATGKLPCNNLDDMLKSAVAAAAKTDAAALSGGTKLLGHYLIVGQRKVIVIFEAEQPHQFFEVMARCASAEWDISPLIEVGRPLFDAAIKADCRQPSVAQEIVAQKGA